MGKVGRPVDPNAKRKNYILRMNDDEAKRLENVSKDLGMKRSDAIRTLVERYEKDMK